MSSILRQYGTATTILFPLIDAGTQDFESTPATFATGDTKIIKDEGAASNATNNPAHEGNGIYSLSLTATEMQAARIVVAVIDQTVTKVWEDQAILVDTYGNASAQHAFDLDTATQNVNVASMDNGVITAAKIAANAITSSEIADNAITAAKIATDAITAAKIAANAITTSELADGTITAAKIATDAITAAKIAADAIGSSELATDAVEEIADQVWDEVLTGATHNVTSSAGRRLRNLQDFGVYEGGFVWIDTVNGTAGTVDFENGTVNNPVDTISDAETLRASVGLPGFHVIPGSSVTLAASLANVEMTGRNYTLALGGQDITGAYIFHTTNVSGTGTGTNGTPFVIENSNIGGATSLASYGFLHKVSVGATLTLTSTGGVTADSINLFSCYSGVAGAGTPTITATGVTKTTNVQIRDWNGGLTFTGTSDCVVSIECTNGGGITVTTGGGDVEIRGRCRSLTVTMSGTETVQFVGTTGAITLSGTTTGTVNLHGISTSLSDTTSGATVTDNTVSVTAINEQVDDVISVDTTTELGGVPAITAPLRDQIRWLFTKHRNKVTSTATTTTIRNDADDGNIATSGHSDDGTTFTRNEYS